LNQLVILTEARSECLLAIADHISAHRPVKPLLKQDNASVRWVRYSTDAAENILKVLQQEVEAADSDTRMLVAIPFVKSAQLDGIRSCLQSLNSKQADWTWFGAPALHNGKKGTDDTIEKVCVNCGKPLQAMGEYAPDLANEYTRTPWEQLNQQQLKSLYTDYRLQLLYMGIGKPGTEMLGIIRELVAQCKPDPRFPWRLPGIPGEERDWLTASQTAEMVRRYQEKGRPTIAGISPVMEQLKRRIRDVALTDMNALIIGETGTGKEGAAYFIHELSGRRTRPYVEYNCAGLEDSYLESMLFGHVKGAFTGATNARAGLVEEVADGTIFLDELPELTPRIQAKLLRFIQFGEYVPFGSDSKKTSRCRIIAGGQPSLIESRLREDLVMRISEAEIRLPSLAEMRDYPDDIITIARNRSDALRGEQRIVRNNDGTVSAKRVTREDVRTFWEQLIEQKELMTKCHWPGNTRELFKTIKQCMLQGIPWKELLESRLQRQAAAGRQMQLRDSSVFGCVSMLPLSDTQTDLLSQDQMLAVYADHLYQQLGVKDRVKEILGISNNQTLNKYLQLAEAMKLNEDAAEIARPPAARKMSR